MKNRAFKLWLGSGQSNMAMTVGRAQDFDQEKLAADLPKIRMFTVTSGASEKAEGDCRGAWVVCSPGTVANFSATLFFCGREIHKALGAVYGRETETSGPLPDGHRINGNKVVCSFTHCRGGLVTMGGELKGFVIAGPDKQWKAASARISGDTVIVSHPDIKEPVAVRYAWADNPVCNLYNGTGLPASPFRTDK